MSHMSKEIRTYGAGTYRAAYAYPCTVPGYIACAPPPPPPPHPPQSHSLSLRHDSSPSVLSLGQSSTLSRDPQLVRQRFGRRDALRDSAACKHYQHAVFMYLQVAASSYHTSHFLLSLFVKVAVSPTTFLTFTKFYCSKTVNGLYHMSFSFLLITEMKNQRV